MTDASEPRPSRRPVPARPFVLNVDIDGVCADYVGAFRRIVARRTGVDVSALGPQSSWDFHRCWAPIRDRDHFLELHHHAVTEDRLFLILEPMPGVAEALWRLNDAGVHVRIVTHRILRHGDHRLVAGDTIAWLDNHNIPYREIAFLTTKADLWGDLSVDDAPHVVEALHAADRDVVIFDHPYNRHLDGPRAATWGDVERLVTDALRRSGHSV